MNLLRPAFASFLRNKKIILYILNISIIIGGIIIIFNYKSTFEKIYKNEIENNIKNRTLFISKDTDNINLNEIMNIKNIKKCEYILNSLTVKASDISFYLKNDVFLDETKIIYGRNCEDDKMEIVIPDSLENAVDLLGNSIDILYKDFVIKAKIVGIYEDSMKLNYSYISMNFIQNLMQYDKEMVDTSECLAVINKYENLDDIMQQLKNKNYNSNLYDTSSLNDIKTYKAVGIILNILIVIMISFIYILLYIIVSNIINSEKKDIAILKAVGYKQLDILKIIVYRLFFITIISFMIGVIINKILVPSMNYKIMQSMNLNLNYNLHLNIPYYAIILLTLIFIIMIASLKNMRKIKLIDTINLLKE